MTFSLSLYTQRLEVQPAVKGLLVGAGAMGALALLRRLAGPPSR